MLELIDRPAAKQKAVATFRRALRSSIPFVGTHTVGFQGENFPFDIFAVGDGRLWFYPSKGLVGDSISRHSNAFGVYREAASSQNIAVEINIPAELNYDPRDRLHRP